MKPKQHTYVDPDDYLGTDENDRQDATVESRFADGVTTGTPAGWTAPVNISDARIGSTRIISPVECLDPGGGTDTVLDASADWRDAYLDRGWIEAENLSTEMPGGTAYQAAVLYPRVELDGYTGKGAQGGVNPPNLIGVGTAGVGEYWTPWANIWLFVDNIGQLTLRNNTGATIYVWGVIGLTGDFGGF